MLSRVAKDPTFYGRKEKQGATEGSMTGEQPRCRTTKIISSHEVFKWAALHTVTVNVSLY